MMASNLQANGVGRMIAPALLLGSMLAVAALYINAQYPDLIQEAQYAIGGRKAVIPINQAEQKEKRRLQRIDALLIATRNKIDLREGRPFWGAASHMVELAFGSAADDVIIHRRGSRMYEFHRYGFGGSREPVVMEFSDNLLICVHYVQRQQTICSPGTQSLYANQPFPFNYKITIGN